MPLGCHQEFLLGNMRWRRIHLVDLADHLGPAFGGHIVWLIFNDGGRGECRGSLAYLASVGIRIKAVVADHDLSLIGNMGEEQPLQAQQRADHVFADSHAFLFVCSSDLTVDIEACVAPAEDLLHQRKPDELFPQQQGEDLAGEDLLDNLVMETTDSVKSTIRGCASFGNQDMDMGMEVDAIPESLDHGHHSRHKLKASGCVQKFHK